MPKNSPLEDYTGKHIVVLQGLSPVRRRPAMYIGSTGKEGLHELIREIIDNSVDEALAGFAKNIWITIHKNNSVTISDDGRGIPVDIMPQYGKSALEIVMTTLHAGAKFDGRVYKVSGGLHGVGCSVVNALSQWLKVEVKRNGKVFAQECRRGKPQGKVKELQTTNYKLQTDWPEFHWEFGKEIREKVEEILKYKISGVIEISSFLCGCDAVLKEFVEKAFKTAKIPFLYLIIDEHTADAGIQTRLEAFIDTLK